MNQIEVDDDVRSMDAQLRAATTPEEAAVDRVRARVQLGIGERTEGGRQQGRRIPRIWYAAAAVAMISCLVAGAVGAALVSRLSSPSQGLASVVVPARPDQQSAGQAQGAAQADRAAGAPYAAQGVTSAAQGGASTFIGGPCVAAPTVQFQGRGLAATGMAPIAGRPSDSTMNLWVSVQERGIDATSVIAAAQAKVTAVVAALQKAGVPGTAIQQSNFSSYGDSQAKQFTANASIQAQVTTDQLAPVSSAVLQVTGVTGYSTSAGIGGQPTADQVQTAVAAAAGQARDMAIATAKAAGVQLGSVDSVVTQPPSVCYVGASPTRVVQVTITYAIK